MKLREMIKILEENSDFLDHEITKFDVNLYKKKEEYDENVNLANHIRFNLATNKYIFRFYGFDINREHREKVKGYNER